MDAAEDVGASFGGFGDYFADFVEVANFDDDAVVEDVAVLFAAVIVVFVIWAEVVVRGFDVFFFDAEFSERVHDFVHGLAVLLNCFVSKLGFDVETEGDFGDVGYDVSFAGGFNGDFAWIVAANALPKADGAEYCEADCAEYEDC